MNNESILHELQKDLISKETDIVSILRKAHIIASKLSFDEFDKWIEYELNGYQNNYDSIPDYRIIRGKLKAYNPYNGLIPVILNDNELETIICVRKIPNSISEIVSLTTDATSNPVLHLSGEEQASINKMCNDYIQMEIVLVLPRNSVVDIIEKVKNKILEWTLTLEKAGITGKGMSFTSEEKKEALQIINNNYYGNANVINGNGNTFTQSNNSGLSYDEVLKLVKEIKKSLKNEKIKKEDSDDANEMIDDLQKKVENNKSKKIIVAMLKSIKDFLIGVGASMTAAIIQKTLF